MGWVAGIDEVGYGPHLGPLVLVSTLFEADSGDLWKILKKAVSRRPDGRRLPVCDSKALFTQKRGVSTLESTALGFLHLNPALRGLALSALSESLEEGSTRGVPWLEKELPLPEGPHEALGLELERQSVRFLGAHARFLEAGEFNNRIEQTGNKNRLHFDAVADVMARVMQTVPCDDVSIRIGKLSGRNRYFPMLQERFGLPVRVRVESRKVSRYVMDDGRRRIEIAFIRDGDATDFCVALASIIAKYLREQRMRLFNEYWTDRIDGLRPTAGYGKDGTRFFKEIRGLLGGLSERDVLRLR